MTLQACIPGVLSVRPAQLLDAASRPRLFNYGKRRFKQTVTTCQQVQVLACQLNHSLLENAVLTTATEVGYYQGAACLARGPMVDLGKINPCIAFRHSLVCKVLFLLRQMLPEGCYAILLRDLVGACLDPYPFVTQGQRRAAD